MNHIKAIRDLSRTCWQSRWYNPHGWSSKDTEQDGWWDHADTVLVIATHLDQLRTRGPHGPAWWRFGHSEWQPIIEALTNTGTKDEYRARQDQRSVERKVQEERRWQEREEELSRREAGKWACPSRGGLVYPGDAWGAPVAPGGPCTVCRTLTDSQQPPTAERAVTAAEAAENNGILAPLRQVLRDTSYPWAGARPETVGSNRRSPRRSKIHSRELSTRAPDSTVIKAHSLSLLNGPTQPLRQ
ncbi:hypothetical protein OG612_42170 (plasmid) [Streptomyces sp. NBC_01527]|uniref:hypothetical protein n=1 Tax=unclassified Streptomyces TaxID=2593676 RepID=UPI002E0E8904|nr:hypothetical protein OG763_46045 [Streptomyces sp. NBC_01230]